MPRPTFLCWCNKGSRKRHIVAACRERGIVVDFNKTHRFVLLKMWRDSLKEGYREYGEYLDTVATDDSTTVGSDGQD